jgi:hypothetical protein
MPKHAQYPQALILLRRGPDEQDGHHAVEGQVPEEFHPVEHGERHMDPKDEQHQRVESSPPRLSGAQGWGPGDQIAPPARPPCEPGHDRENDRDADAMERRVDEAGGMGSTVRIPSSAWKGRAGGSGVDNPLSSLRGFSFSPQTSQFSPQLLHLGLSRSPCHQRFGGGQ